MANGSLCCDSHVVSHRDTHVTSYMSSYLKSCEKLFCFNLNYFDPIQSQLCTWHYSSAVMTYAKLWLDWIVEFYIRAACILQDLDYDLLNKLFMRWIPGVIGYQNYISLLYHTDFIPENHLKLHSVYRCILFRISWYPRFQVVLPENICISHTPGASITWILCNQLLMDINREAWTLLTIFITL